MDYLRDFLHSGERGFDKLKSTLSEKLGLTRPVQIVAYRGFGTSRRVEIFGRLLEQKKLKEASKDDNAFNNIVRMVKRMESDELAHADIAARYRNETQQKKSNEEGYFSFVFDGEWEELTSLVWDEIELQVDYRDETSRAVGHVLMPPANARFAVVSDIDDTVIQTDAANLLKALANTFLGNAKTRMPFDGVAELYHALQNGGGSTPLNPIFYVSNGPWNLYDFLSEFMAHNELPKGPIFLRDYGLDSEKWIKDDQHKEETIARLMAAYPDLPFILIGDSGEKDPEIYQRVSRKYGDRLLAIYIRDVSDDERDREVEEIAAEVSSRGIPMRRVADSAAVLKHARELNLVSV